MTLRTTAATLLMILLLLTGCDSPLNDGGANSWQRGDQLRWRIAENQPEHRTDTLAMTGSKANPVLRPNAVPKDYVNLAMARNP